ncbi:hypothetical protein B0H94_11160 [Salsuginibacillus halophilus]|uniref:MFS transporter n=2 Tax=Salsuginibacillus halophilus TaxID=517424 RepID=A0A2P8HAI5_9BACI|nr:hypothetical protein B0H94_11160 [Salsuginibacillus halophilus]
MVEVYNATSSVFGAATVIGVMSLSTFVSGMVASLIINNYKLTQVIHVAGWFRAVFVLIIGGLLLHITPVTLLFLYITLMMYAFVTAWYQPARFALLPLIVSKEDYVKGNGLLVMIQQTLMTAGWAIGGVLNVLVSFPYLIIFTALAFITSGVLATAIRTNERLEKKSVKKHAWKKVWQIPVVRNITLMETFEGMANAIWTSALLLSFTHVILNQGADVWGFINAAYFTGAILGSVLVTWQAKLLEFRIGIMIGLSGVSMGLLTLLFSMNDIVLLALLLCVLMGPMYQARDICQTSILQDAIPADERPNVMAARSAFLKPWNGLMVMAVGGLADIAGVQTIYIAAGLLYLLSACIAFQSKALRNYEIQTEEQVVEKEAEA